jgi:hypothetical protein
MIRELTSMRTAANSLGLTTFSLVVLSVVAWALAGLYFSTGHGHLDFGRHAVGRDFVIFWTGGHLVAAGTPLAVFDPATFLAAARAMFDPSLPFHFWSYPPTALLVVTPLGWLDYFPAYYAWNVVGLALLGLATFAFCRERRDAWLVMTSPAVAVNLVMGQNGFLTAALLFAGLSAWKQRPGLAGFWFGLLTFKPQLGLLIPVSALSVRKWWLIAAAVFTAAAFAALSAGVFGVAAWRDFVQLTLPEQSRMMLHGVGPFQLMSPSALMSGRVLHLAPQMAIMLQAPFTLLGAWLSWRAYGRAVDPRLSASLLLVATFVASPQVFNYDLIPLSAASLVLARGADDRLDQILAALLWAGPLVVMLLNVMHVPAMPLILAAAGLRLDRIAARAGTETSDVSAA